MAKSWTLQTASGAIQNLNNWKDMNGCSGQIPDVNEPGALFTVQGFSDCTNNAQVRLVTYIFMGITHIQKTLDKRVVELSFQEVECLYQLPKLLGISLVNFLNSFTMFF